MSKKVYCDVYAVGIDIAWQRTRMQQWENCVFYGVHSQAI
jgi:hypothetical protein